MNVCWIIDWGIRVFVYPFVRVDITLIGVYTTGRTPGKDGAAVALGIATILFLLSVMNQRKKIL